MWGPEFNLNIFVKLWTLVLRVSGRNKYIVPGEYLTTPTLLHASGRWYLKNIPQHDVYRRLFIARFTAYQSPSPTILLFKRARLHLLRSRLFLFFSMVSLFWLKSSKREKEPRLQKFESYNFCCCRGTLFIYNSNSKSFDLHNWKNLISLSIKF